MRDENFVKQAVAVAIKCWKAGGSPPGIAVAQAVLESNWGKSQLSRKANNYFGIKSHGQRVSIVMSTTECDSGESKKVSAGFAVYASMEECFAERERLIANGKYYADARKLIDCPEKFARSLAKHWATDPEYAGKILKIYRQLNLPQVDAQCGFSTGEVL